ncbi:MAG: FtsX-like permease family protein [Gammaproteobacteria bacterium]|nr:FtsX-like permease family protein [Gammaproteobacteria bacterium]NNC98236.1 FtsX-like permease family protein [Gammaproteobacteria bacterium]NNM14534.1 FtsX-like permease family protein [Gammaproteobacteria bacterium]
MKYLRFIASNLKRNKTRLLFTMLSIITAFILFGMLSALKVAFSAGADIAGKDRMLTLHKVTFTQPLPESYGSRIAAIDGVKKVSHATWFGAVYKDPRNQLALFPVIPEEYVEIYPELKVVEGSLEDWMSNRQGILISKSMADRFAEEWKIGDRIPIQSSIWRKNDGGNTWELDFSGVYQLGDDIDDGGMLMHYKYFDEGRSFGQGSVGWYVLQIADPEKSASVAKAVDKLFENSSAETKTATEAAFAQSFAGQIGDMGKIINAVVSAVFFTMLLVVANTMSQSIRERTSEIGVLKTLGFSDNRVMGMVMLESLFITLLAAGLGLLLAYLIVNNAEGIRKFFPIFYLPQKDIISGLFIALLMGLIAGIMPATQALKLKINDAMRRVV